jgi:hypothetical protein
MIIDQQMSISGRMLRQIFRYIYLRIPFEMQMRSNRGAPGSAWGGEALLYGQSIWIYGKVLEGAQGGVCSCGEQENTKLVPDSWGIDKCQFTNGK